MSGPLTLRLLPGRPLTLEGLIHRLTEVHGTRRMGRLVQRFMLSSREVRFVRTLQSVKGNLWVWRCRQDAFAGDFVVVDMSPPEPGQRRAIVLELKKDALVRPTAGHQMRNAPAVLAEIAARSGAIDASTPWQPLTGDGGALVDVLSGGRRTTL